MIIPEPTSPNEYTQSKYTDQISSNVGNLTNSSYWDCEKKCDSLPNCKGFNFQSDLYENGKGECWMKDNVTNTISTKEWHLFSKK